MTTQPVTHTSASLYVGDLNPDVTEGLLFELFKRVGTVTSIRVCRDSITKRSLGYSYVNFANANDAERALDTLNNTPIKGRACRIMWSQRDPTLRRSGVGNIFIRNLDPNIDAKELHDTFSQFGNIISCKVATYSNGDSKGYGYVHFENPANAQQAIDIVNGKKIRNKTVTVSKFIPRQERLKRIENTWTNVYIKNLHPSVEEIRLKDIFAPYGELTSVAIMRDEGGNSRGFGFANFVNHSDAQSAVTNLNGQIIDDMEVICCRAQKKSERLAELKRQYEQRRRERINKYQGLNIYVKHIEDHISEDTLRKKFEPYGKILSCKIMKNEKGHSKGFGFVCFSSQEEANRAIQEIGRNTILPNCSKPLYVALHEPKEYRQQRFSNRFPRAKGNIQGPVFPQYNYPPPSLVPPPQQHMMRTFSQGMPSYVMTPLTGRPNQSQRIPPQNPARLPGNVRGKGMHGPGQRKPQVLINEDLMENQRNMLGDVLFRKISEIEPELAGRITGMIINTDLNENTLKDINEILSDDKRLEETVNEAKKLLSANSAVPPNDEV